MTGFLGPVFNGIAHAIDVVQTDDANQQLGGANSTGGKFEVDLPTLYQYFNDVKSTLANLQQRIATLTKAAAHKPVTTDITGVNQSITSSVDGAVGPRDSLLSALVYTADQLTDHLTAISQIYMQYINADEQHAASLSAAGNPSAAKYTLSSNSTGVTAAATPKADISSLFTV